MKTQATERDKGRIAHLPYNSERVSELSDRLGVGIRVVSREDAEAEGSVRKRNAKSCYGGVYE